MKSKTEFSAGGCVFKTLTDSSDVKTLWLVGVHSGYGKWVLPKGRLEAEETPEETAVREVEEEMGVTAKIIRSEPVFVSHYTYTAVVKPEAEQAQVGDQPVRRVITYQESSDFESQTDKVSIDKTVNFYLMEYVSGDPGQHDWEMSAAEWLSLDEAIAKLAFDDEKKALSRAAELVASLA